MKHRKFWFIVGSQDLYGQEVLDKDGHSAKG